MKQGKEEPEFHTTAQYYNALRYSAKFVAEKIGEAEIAVVLGSGLGGLVDTLTDPLSLDYSEIPYMPQTSVVGHGKHLYNGKVGDKKVLLWSGRVHMYEGYSSHQLTFITYMSAFLGCKYIILTNSSGGGMEGMKHGSFMVSKDHINYAAKCPIPTTFNDPRFGERNPKSSLAHSKYLKDLSLQCAKDLDMELFEGNYSWTTGPAYETPLEATVLRKFGGGCFGMSTVPEILAAGQIGLECVVLTMITNLAAGLQKVLTHLEVHNEAMKAGPRLGKLVSSIIQNIDMKRETNIKLKDQISNEHILHSYKMKNPKPQYPVKDWISDALEILHATNCGHDRVDEAYWFMSTGAHRDIIKNADLKDIRELPFDEIPNMPTKTSSARHSKIIFATTSVGKRVMLILNNFLEGLVPTEAFFLVHLLKANEISMIKFIIEAATTGRRENLNDGCFVVASDYINKSWFPPCDPNLNYFYPFKSIQRHLQKKFKGILCDNLGKEVSDFDDICFILQDGPCFPTNANVDMYRFANQDLVTITNTAAIDCANTLGLLQMTFVMVRDQDFVMHENSKGKEIAKVLFENFSNEMISADIHFESNRQLIQDHIKEFANHNRSLDYSSIEHIEVDLPLLSDVELLDNTVKQIQDFLDLGKSSYIGIQMHHFSYNQISDHFKIKKAVKFVSKSRMNQSLPELIHCTLVDNEDVDLLVVKGMLVHQIILEPSVRSMPTRILHKLGANKFVVIGNVFAAHEDMNVGDIFLPIDHMNMSVLNPTTGKNVDEWGKRFYDVSKCYDDTLISKFQELAQNHEDCTVWKSQIFYTNNAKPYAGRAEKRFCQGIGKINDSDCMGISFQGYCELMTIRHMDFEDTYKTIYIGIIFDKCVNEEDDYKIENINITEYSKGINKAMNVFKEFIKSEELA